MLGFLPVLELPKYKTNLHVRQPTITTFSHQENVYAEPV